MTRTYTSQLHTVISELFFQTEIFQVPKDAGFYLYFCLIKNRPPADFFQPVYCLVDLWCLFGSFVFASLSVRLMCCVHLWVCVPCWLFYSCWRPPLPLCRVVCEIILVFWSTLYLLIAIRYSYTLFMRRPWAVSPWGGQLSPIAVIQKEIESIGHCRQPHHQEINAILAVWVGGGEKTRRGGGMAYEGDINTPGIHCKEIQHHMNALTFWGKTCWK
jgi:hypothetical protein